MQHHSRHPSQDNPSDNLEHTWFHRQIIEASPLPTVLVDVQSNDMPLVYVNSAFEHMTGYQRDEVLGKNPRFLQGSDQSQPGVENMRAAIHEYKSCHATLRNYRKDGSLFWNEVRLSPIVDHQGTVTHYLGILQDITEHRRQEALRTSSESIYRAITENLPNGMIALYDHDLRYTFAEGQGLRELGMSGADLVGKRLRDVFPPEVYERDEPTMRAALQGKTSTVVVPFGEEGYFRVITVPVYDDSGKIINGLVLSQNITPLKQAEHELRQHEQELRALLDKNPDVIARFDAAGNIRYVNIAAATFLKASVQALISNDSAAESHPYLTQILESVNDNRFEDHHERSLDIAVEMPDDTRHFHIRIIPERDETGALESVLTIGRDITDLKHAQQQQFEIALEKERVQMLARFIQDAAHEFRTPLATISTHTFLLLHSDDLQQRQQEAKKIEQQVMYTSALVDMMMQTARLESAPLQVAQLSIGQLVDECCRFYATTHDTTTFDVQIAPNTPDITGDARLLRQAVHALLDNAHRYGNANGTVYVWVDHDNTHVTISVKDEGPGITDTAKPLVFNTFWRQDQARSTPGLGLGLPIARKITQLHHGYIELESQPEEGSVFRISLPITHQ